MTNFKKVISRSKTIFYFLFSMIFLLAILSCLTIVNSSREFTRYREMAVDSNVAKNLLNDLMFLRMSVKNYIYYGSEKFEKQFDNRLAEVEASLIDAESSIQNSERVRLLKETASLFADYKSAFQELVLSTKEKAELVKNLETSKASAKALFGDNPQSLSEQRKYLYGAFESFYWSLQKQIKSRTEFQRNLNNPLTVLTFQLQEEKYSRDLALLNEHAVAMIGLQRDIVKASKKQLEASNNKLDKIGPVIASKLDEIARSIQAVQDQLGPRLVWINTLSFFALLIVSLGVMLISLLSFLGLFRQFDVISATISSLSDDLNQSTRDLREISRQTSGSSEKVSKTTEQQASFLLETTSALEEIEKMTRRSLQSVQNATENTAKMKKISEKANGSMNELNDSMAEIKRSNEMIENFSSMISEIERKTRLIDEIVSQSKILSFNASVEAERAGAHGKGFAVVAEEVGFLAKNSGDIAREIQDIVIESQQTVDKITNTNREKVDEGNQLTKSVSKIFSEISDTCIDVLNKNENVLEAANEQVTGIGQINRSVTRLDTSTQENAAVARDTSKATKQIATQAQDLTRVVDRLDEIFGKNDSGISSQNRVIGFFDSWFDKVNQVHSKRNQNSPDRVA